MPLTSILPKETAPFPTLIRPCRLRSATLTPPRSVWRRATRIRRIRLIKTMRTARCDLHANGSRISSRRNGANIIEPWSSTRNYICTTRDSWRLRICICSLIWSACTLRATAWRRSKAWRRTPIWWVWCFKKTWLGKWTGWWLWPIWGRWTSRKTTFLRLKG